VRQRVVQGRGGAGIPTVRLSITVEERYGKQLEAIAQEKRVSVAWVVRDALEEYLNARQTPSEGPLGSTERP
jgi:predicted DNA-binding ribbon-helix-helix protein